MTATGGIQSGTIDGQKKSAATNKAYTMTGLQKMYSKCTVKVLTEDKVSRANR